MYGHKLRTLFVGLLFSFPAMSQSSSAVNGIVTDSSGAAIPGVRITATEVDTGLTRETVSSADGLYVLSSLRPARYTFSAAAQSFRTFTQTGITLRANDTVTINLKLEVGAASQTITVEEAAAQVDTTSATLKQVVDSARIVDLPLNGRNAATLTALVAGAVNGPTDNADLGSAKTFPGAVTVSVNGGRQNNIAFSLDGVQAEDLLSNVNQPLPMPDALQEFSFQTSNFSAEYGGNSAGIVNIVTRSGTNVIHGDAFEFVRNAVFNARNFFAPSRDQLKRNQFGGTLGGPVIKDKLFIFGGYQGARVRNTQGGLSATVPTAANVAGDFSNLLSATDPANPLGRSIAIKDPLTGGAFLNNQIPASRFDPASVALLKFLPGSSSPNGRAFYSAPVIQNQNEIITRADYSISGSDRLNYRFNKNWYDQPGIFANNNLLTYANATPDTSYNTALQETHIFSPTLLNDFRFGVTRIITSRVPPGNSPSVTDLGVANVSQTPYKAMEGITVSGYFSFGAFETAIFPRTTFDWYDTVRWVKGRHNLALGGSFERARMNTVSNSHMDGAFTFSGDITGSAMADFLLGKLRTFSQGAPSFQHDRNIFFSLFAQDTFKVSSRLTLNYGLRWEPSIPFHDLYNQETAFSPALYAQGVVSKKYVNAPPGLLFPGDPGFPVDGRTPSWNNISPRIGFAYDVSGDGKTSIRGGTGIFQNAKVTGYSNNAWTVVSPFSPTVNITNPTGPFSNPYLGINNPFPVTQPTPSTFVFPTPITVASWDTSHYKLQTPTVYNWNLTLERQLRTDWLVRAAYVGSRTLHLFENEQLNPGIYIPGSSLSLQARRPFQPYGSIVQLTASGMAWYHSMQLTLEKRLSHGFTLLANYSLSKSTDNTPTGTDLAAPTENGILTESPYVPNFKAIDKGPSDFDYRHTLVVSYVWQLPGLAHANAWMRGLAGGWELSGITTAQSGGPFNILAGLDQSQTGIGFDRAQLVGQQPYSPGGPCANQAPCISYLDPSAFATPPLGTYGNIGKGAFRGPGLFDTDLGMFKTFAVKERLNIQFRAEFFNIFNRANLNSPINVTTGSPPFALGDSINGAGFGKILSARDPRIGQLALKILF